MLLIGHQIIIGNLFFNLNNYFTGRRILKRKHPMQGTKVDIRIKVRPRQGFENDITRSIILYLEQLNDSREVSSGRHIYID